MRHVLVALMIAVHPAPLHALDIDPFKGPRPVAVLIQKDPWLMVVGSDTPMVAIYDDGQVVYLKREKGKAPDIVVKHLSAGELSGVRRTLASFGDYSTVERHYNLAPGMLDAPETRIYLAPGHGNLVTAVYGLMLSDSGQPVYAGFVGDRRAGLLPVPLRKLHAYLASIDFPDAKPWEPPYVEVMLWGYEYAPEESIHWPGEWPGLDSPNALKRGDAYSIFLPGKELPKLWDFLRTRKEKGAVEMAGRKWAVSVRYTYPGEPAWSRAFRTQRAR